jgi:hypothetical protein
MTRKTYRSVSAIALAALLAGGATVLPNFSGEGCQRADPQRQGRPADIRAIGTQCSDRAWPYFEANCLRDKRVALGKAAQTARIVTADRVSLGR